MVTAKRVDFGSNLESNLLSKTLCYSHGGGGGGRGEREGKRQRAILYNTLICS